MNVSPDGYRYLAMAKGLSLPKPFCYRWIIPKLCQQSEARWKASTYFGIALTFIGTVFLAPNILFGLAAATLLISLPFITFNLRFPVLVDSPALGLSVCSAALIHNGFVWPAVALAILSGCVKETSPIFAALFAWNPLLLIGLISPLIRKAFCKAGSDVLDQANADILSHPFRAGREWHLKQLVERDKILFAPWGAALICLAIPSWQLAAVLIIAYAQLIVATDTVRLYQWAAPIVCISAVTVLPIQYSLLIILATWFNPFRGPGY